MFRSLGKSKVGLILAILFGVSLLFFKSGSRYSNFFNSDSVVATVSGTPISNTKFNRTLEMNINNFNKIFGKKLDSDEIRSFNIHKLALNSLISNAVFENEYNNLKFKLDDKIIAQKTKDKIPQLYDSNNKLNNLYLKSFLEQQQLNIEDIVQIIDFETRDNYFQKSFFEFAYPLIFSNQIQNYENHKREILFIDFKIEDISLDSLIENNSADDNLIELDKFYNENIINYMSREKRDIEYIVIDKNLIKNNFIPTNFEITEYYNQNKKLFLENEKRNFVQFNFKNKNDAIKFKNTIQNLNTSQIIDFASQNNIKFNEFKNLQSNEILDDLSSALFNLKINQQSEVIETSLANHILILQSIKKSNQKKLKDVKNDIIASITEIDTNNYYKDLSNDISSKVLSGGKLEDIKKKFDLKINSIKNLTRESNVDAETNQIIYSDLIQKSFNSNKDFVSDVISVNENLSYIFDVKDIKISEPLPFKKIKNQVFKDWKYNKRSEEIRSSLKENSDKPMYILDLAKDYKSKIKKMIISKDDEELPKDLLKKVFKGQINQNLLFIDKNKVYVAKIDNIIIPNKTNFSETISIADELRASFGEELIKKKNINVNEALINALIERY